MDNAPQLQFPELPPLYRPVRHVTWDNGKSVSKKIVAIGINPVTMGQPGQVSKYLKTLSAFLNGHGYSDYNDLTLMNLFSHVATDPKEIDEKSVTDFRKYRDLLEAADVILLTWGTQGDKCAEQKEAALEVLKDYEEKVYCIAYQGKGPIHPSRMSYDSEIVKANIRVKYPDMSWDTVGMSNGNLDAIPFSDMLFVAVASDGAQGSPGSIVCMDKTGRLYRGYYEHPYYPGGIPWNTLVSLFPALRVPPPKGWREAYFGMGNGFLINETHKIGAAFSRFIGTDFDQSDIYGEWGEIARMIIRATKDYSLEMDLSEKLPRS